MRVYVPATLSTVAELVERRAVGPAPVAAFAVTAECDAHPEFKRVLDEATPEDIVEFTSVAGLPARAVRTPWLDKYLRNELRLKEKALASVTSPEARPGRFRPDDQLLAYLEAL